MARLIHQREFRLSPLVEALRRLGHDVLTIQETGKAGQAAPDEAVLEFACSEKRVLVTLNRKHFIRLHGEKPDHFGIIVCSFDPDFEGLAHRIDQAISKRKRSDREVNPCD
jgi:hypothetical protein